MMHHIQRQFLSMLLALAIMIGLMPLSAVPTQAAFLEEGAEYPAQAQYDFEIPGSTIRFLDKNGDLLTEEPAWTEGDNVVTTWHVFLYRSQQEDLKLGYSTEGTLFIPHKVYEGDTADLLYAKDNNLFRVTANKDAQQIFDGSELLKPVTLTATDGTTTLANAPVYAQTPFAFAYLGNTDENGQIELNTTLGQFTLWVASNKGYILNKAVTISDSTEEISFAEEIANAIQIDATGRMDADPKGPGYVLAIGKAGETDVTNLLTTSYIRPDQTVRVTPGTYRVAAMIFVKDQNYYYDEYSGLWVDLTDNMDITKDTAFRFSLADFEGKYALNGDMEVVAVEQTISCRMYAEDANGYTIPGRAESPWYMEHRVEVADNGVLYPYTFQWEAFSMLYDAYIYSGEEELVYQKDCTDEGFILPYFMFDKTEQEYTIQYYPEFDAEAFPDLFPLGEYYSTSFKTQTLSEDTCRILVSPAYIYSAYYLDENGKQQDATRYFGPEEYYYAFPADVKNGDSIVLVIEDWSTRTLDYNVVTVTDELFDEPYLFQHHETFSSVSFNVKMSAEDENYYQISLKPYILAGHEKFCITEYGMDLALPRGQYIMNVVAINEIWDEEICAIGEVEYISHEQTYLLTEPIYEIELDCSGYHCFGIDASAFYPDNYWAMDNLMKQLSLHFADGSVRYVDWNTAPLTIYIDTMPEYAQGEMYYNEVQEMYPFSPYVSVDRFEIEEGQTYRFDFKPSAVEVVATEVGSSQNVVVTYQVTDGFGAKLNDLWNLLNPHVTHRPLTFREYPFRDAEGTPVDHHYVVDVYYRLKGTETYTVKSVSDFTRADLGVLAEGEYEGYVEINLDIYCDEYLVEYPIEKGIYYDEWWGEFISVHDNVDRVLHGILRDEFEFAVSGQAHVCSYDEGTVTLAPTCMAEGVKTYTCVGCGAAYTEVIPTIDHIYQTDIVYATCTEDGYLTQTCTMCGDTTVEVLPAFGHGYQGVPTEPTCTEPGYTTYYCNCGDNYVADEVPALGHSYENGYCTRCQDLQLLDQGQCGENLYWTLDAFGKLTITGTGDMWNFGYYSDNAPWAGYQISEVIVEPGATSIGQYAFIRQFDLKKAVLPQTVTVIEHYAFYCCEGMTELTLPDRLTFMGDSAFGYCSSLRSVKIPAGLQQLANHAFVNCYALQSVTLPAGMTAIGNYAFSQCYQLRSVTLPEGLKTISTQVFRSCYNLRSINIPASVDVIEPSAFEGCEALTQLDLPETMTQIGDHAFHNTGLYSLTIPEGITVIPDEMVSFTENLTTVVLPQSLQNIGGYSFRYCSGLKNIQIPNTVTEIGSYAFTYCTSLESMEIPDSVTQIGIHAFDSCTSLSYIKLPADLDYITESMLQSCHSLEAVTLPKSLLGLHANALRDCVNLKQITIPGTLQDFGSDAFDGCKSLTTATVESGVTRIGYYGFSNCTALKEVNLPDTLTTLDDSAFTGCINLETIHIPAGVTFVGDRCFYNTTSLKLICFAGDAPTFEEWAFLNVKAVVQYSSKNAGWTEEVRQNYNGEITWEDVYIAVVPTLKPKYPSVSFEDEVIMNVYFSAEDLDDVVEMGLVTYYNPVTEADIATADAVTPTYSYNEASGFYVTNTPGIAAKCLGDTIYFAVYAKLTDGSYAYSVVRSYSPSTYAYTQLASSVDTMKPLVVAMLNYGAEAQKFFGYNTDNLVNATITAEQQALVKAYSPDMVSTFTPVGSKDVGEFAKSSTGFSRKYPSVTFEGAFSINYYCIPDADLVGDITMYVWNEKDFTNASRLTRENATEVLTMTYNADKGEYGAAVEGIAAKNLDQGVYVAFVYNDGLTTYCSGVLAYSIASYNLTLINANNEQTAFAKATAVYGYYAKLLLPRD